MNSFEDDRLLSPSVWQAGRVLLGALAFWAAFVSMATTYAVLNVGYRYRVDHLPFDLSLVAIGALIGTALWLVLRRLTGWPFSRQLAAAVFLIALAAIPFQLLVSVATAWLLPGAAAWKAPCAGTVAAGAIFWLAPLGVWSAMVLAVFHDMVARQREQRLAMLRTEAQEAQLRALRYQVNPHFLYNTLNSISALVLDGRTDEAETMIMRLSDFFRATLQSDAMSDVALAEELALQRRYLDVESLRFADRLSVDIDVEAEVAQARVPGLILQPLVENALKHGMSKEGRQTRVRLSAAREGDRLVVHVSDNGCGSAAPSGTGVGLANVRRRLAARFGPAAKLRTWMTVDGYTARLEMPLTA